MDMSLVARRWSSALTALSPTVDEVPETGHQRCGVGDLDVAGAP